MKKLFIMGLAAMGLALTACNSDETVEMAKGNAIGFKTFVNNSTRGIDDDITKDNIKEFKVWGLMNKGGQTGQTGTPFNGTVVNKGDNGWSYTTPVYWEKGYTYSFVALAPSTAKYEFTAPKAVGTWGSLTFENETGVKDLLFAANNYGPANWEGNKCPGAVNMQFNHMLSRVRFNFVNGMNDGSTLSVKNVKITNAYSKATATLGENLESLVWSDQNTPAEMAFGNALTEGFAQNANGTTDHKYLIPAVAEDLTVTFTVVRAHNGVVDEYKHEVKIEKQTLLAGNSYQFSATFDNTNIKPNEKLCQIQFTATVADWGTTWPDNALVVKKPAAGN